MIRQQLKTAAKQQIKGKIGILFVITLVMALVGCIPVVSFILPPALTLSMYMIYLGITYGNTPGVGDLFQGAKYLGKAWWLNILVIVFTALWSMLFVIPGIIKGLSYSMSYFVLAENPTLTARQALNESKRLMKGHVGELFVLQLSFIGWIILCMFTFCIPMIWVGPYMQTTLANYYHYLKQTAQPQYNYNGPEV